MVKFLVGNLLRTWLMQFILWAVWLWGKIFFIIFGVCARNFFQIFFFCNKKLPSTNKMMSPLEFLFAVKRPAAVFCFRCCLQAGWNRNAEAGSDAGRSDSTGLIRLVRLLRIVRIARIARCRLGRPLGESSRMMTSPGFRWLKRWKLPPFPPWLGENPPEDFSQLEAETGELVQIISPQLPGVCIYSQVPAVNLPGC